MGAPAHPGKPLFHRQEQLLHLCRVGDADRIGERNLREAAIRQDHGHLLDPCWRDDALIGATKGHADAGINGDPIAARLAANFGDFLQRLLH